MNYSFDTDVAKEYGVFGAIMIKNIQFWILKHKAEDRNFYDGRYWTFNSVKGWADLFSFWSPKQIRIILESLVERGVLRKGNYNKSPYDRTLWYAFEDEEKWIGEKGKIDLPIRANEIAPSGKSLTDNNTDNNRDVVVNGDSPVAETTTSPFDRFVDWWNGELIPVEDNVNGNVVKIQVKSQKRKQMFKARWNDTKAYMRNRGMAVDDESVFVYMTDEVIGGNYVNSDWMRGKVKGNGYETGYRVEFDNIFTPKMWTGLLEKKYYNRSLDKVKYDS